MRGVNLIPAPRRAAHVRRHRIHGWCIGVSAYAAALLIVWVAAHLWWPDRQRLAAAELDAVQQQIQADQATFREVRPRLRTAMSTLAASRSVGDQPDWSLLLTLLSDLLGDDAVLSSCELTTASSPPRAAAPGATAQPVVSLAGMGRSHAAVLGYVRSLEATGLFRAVTLLDAQQQPFANGIAVAFRIRCTLAGRPAYAGAQAAGGQTSR